MSKLTNDKGEVAVLYSPGFGAGWSTSNSSHKECLFDAEVAQWVLDGKPEASRPDVESRYGDDFYDGGMSDLEVCWMTPGTAFRINEYDGSESIEFVGECDWSVA